LGLHDLPDTYFEEFVPKVDAVSLDEVSRVAGQYLDVSRMATLIVGDVDRIGPELPALGEAALLNV
jgi:predicted Zn-dependent peptidase